MVTFVCSSNPTYIKLRSVHVGEVPLSCSDFSSDYPNPFITVWLSVWRMLPNFPYLFPLSHKLHCSETLKMSSILNRLNPSWLIGQEGASTWFVDLWVAWPIGPYTHHSVPQDPLDPWPIWLVPRLFFAVSIDSGLHAGILVCTSHTIILFPWVFSLLHKILFGTRIQWFGLKW